MNTKQIQKTLSENDFSFTPLNLIEMLKETAISNSYEIENEFDLWDKVIASLPLSTSEYRFASGWLISAKQLWEQGQNKAALYQIRQVAKKLSFHAVEDVSL